ncbi:hypothetical protein [Halopiger goleimassiliensis]|uniref:hypothetical protein n=1 Tax=Halopiger goleimassiliensis TaxID=1293048 RepID=UPI0006782FA8|nr:hypothetical protein [Halopiger goleimassiliensis]
MEYARSAALVVFGIVLAYAGYVVAKLSWNGEVVPFLFSAFALLLGLFVTALGAFRGLEHAVAAGVERAESAGSNE